MWCMSCSDTSGPGIYPHGTCERRRGALTACDVSPRASFLVTLCTRVPRLGGDHHLGENISKPPKL